jgi:hypothetical protein
MGSIRAFLHDKMSGIDRILFLKRRLLRGLWAEVYAGDL